MTSTFKAIAIPHKFSLSSYLLKAHSRDQNGRSCTNCGTCFFVALDAQSTLLVTNWHMLTGCDPVTGQRSTGWIGSPDTIDIAVMRQEGETVPFASITTNLYDQGKPNWVEHKSRRKPGYDLAMIRLGKTLELRVMELNLSDIQNGSRIVPGNECFVIGFPFGDSLEYPMSIWKRATIASGSMFDVKGEPRFLVDTATRPGMSGSPVFLSSRGLIMRRTRPTPTHELSKNEAALEQILSSEIVPSSDPQGELIMDFCGVYQGVFTDRIERDFQLGYVIEAQALTELISAPQPGTNELPPAH